jgi:carbamoyltransferase
MIILGINAFHGDSSASLFIDGQLIAAVEEERFKRLKHWAGFPIESIKYCLAEAGLALSDVNHISINQNSKFSFFKKISFLISNKFSLGFLIEKIKNKSQQKNIHQLLSEAFPNENIKAKLSKIEHHLAHLASAFYVSPFNEAVVVSVDGFGDFASAAWGVGHDTKITVDKRIYFPHSLGIFYQALTQFIGFPHYGDEYKVMGLAPYGKPNFIPQMREILKLKSDGSFELNLKYFRHDKEKIDYEWSNGLPRVGMLYSEELIKLLGSPRRASDRLTQRHKDIAHSIQLMYEEAFFHLLNNVYKKYKIENLTLAGGCAMNSVANGKIHLKTPFKSIYIQAAAGDAGGAIGSALVTWHKNHHVRGEAHNHAYWGPSFSNELIGTIIKNFEERMKDEHCKIIYIDDLSILYEKTVHAISKGHVIGWFQGRMEWGPRALGNRSILCDPSRKDIKDILNLKIKRRESFRPFAPSILKEDVHDWFEYDADVPFMMQVYQIKKNKQSLIPAVTHVDGSGRLQTVHKSTNPRYYDLIKTFKKLTGIPMLLNTSFNENEPMVCKPEEAIECFLRTKMDVLVLGNYYISREH